MGSKAEKTFSAEFVASHLMKAAVEIFRTDPRMRSLGVGHHHGRYGFVAIRNTEIPLPQGIEIRRIDAHARIPVSYVDTTRDPESLAKVIQIGVAREIGVPEQSRHRPLLCGLETQNFDDDQRNGLIDRGQISVGTIGCLVRLRKGSTGFLSNNHVVAGQNRGVRGKDRILQAGGVTISAGEEAGVLADFVVLLQSTSTANASVDTARLNSVDAGCVEIALRETCEQRYLPLRKVPAPCGTAKAQIGDKVFKVGRTTGLTWGEVTQTPVVVGPIRYDIGPCWFRRAILIESVNKKPFSDSGDSGSAIVRDDGKVIGLLFAGNGSQTWACPIQEVTRALKCVVL